MILSFSLFSPNNLSDDGTEDDEEEHAEGRESKDN